MKLLTLLIITCVGVATQAQTVRDVRRAPKTRNEAFTQLRPEHTATLSRWLNEKPWLRLATKADYTDAKPNIEYLRKQWGKDFNPYYSKGDFNHDGKED